MTHLIVPEPGSRLELLAALYDEYKAEADAAAARLKEISDGIKAEMAALLPPDADSAQLTSRGLSTPLRLIARTSWRMDVKKLKEEQPETYVRYAKPSTTWELRRTSING